MHTRTLDMGLLQVTNDYVDFVRANHFTQVPALLQLSLRLLQLQINPSNVWHVLVRLVHKPQLAAVCDEAIIFVWIPKRAVLIN